MSTPLYLLELTGTIRFGRTCEEVDQLLDIERGSRDRISGVKGGKRLAKPVDASLTGRDTQYEALVNRWVVKLVIVTALET